MHYQNVCLESFGYTLPGEIVTSTEIESRLAPLYERLRLPEGRLELMTGIRERRFWERGTLPSTNSVISAEKAIRAAGIDREEIGVLIHGSVCRDHLEPATACRVHHELGLREECVSYDVSNACLGLMNGALQIANMIELGQVRAGLVVGSEGSRELVETTIDTLNKDLTLTRAKIKMAVASLTIGSGSCAMLLTHRDISGTGNQLVSACVRAHSQHHALCHSGSDEAAAEGMSPLMQTDSETLMRQGIAAGATTFKELLSQEYLGKLGWGAADFDRTVCHQVGSAHRKMMLESLGMPMENDYATLEWLGNTGSVALPISMAHGLESGFIQPGHKVGMFGIGSGINCIMMGVDWKKSLVSSTLTDGELASLKVRQSAAENQPA